MGALRDEGTLVQWNQSEKSSNWYAIYTRPRFEKQVYQRLTELGVEAYLPLVKTLRQWSDRKKMVEVPLFSSYVFVLIDRKQYDLVLQVTGVVKYITFEGKAATIPDEQINSLKIIVNSNEKVETTWEPRKRGDKVEVCAGSLKGLTGELISDGERKKVLVRIDSINQNLTVEVHSSLLETISEQQQSSK